ncbi:MAG: amidohydrolase family protein [Dehalococcoidia bacterium]
MPEAPRRIDVHHHFVPPGYHEILASRAPAVLRGMTFPAWEADAALAVMDASGVETAILSIPVWGLVIEDRAFAIENARWANERLASVVASNPKRFGGFAALPVLHPDAALGELAFALDTLRLDGVVLPASAATHYLGSPHFDPLFAELDRRRAVVHVHPGAPHDCGGLTPAVPEPIVEFVFDTTRAIANLIATGTLERFPGIRFIFSHAGGTVPFLLGRLEMLRANPAVRPNVPRPVREYLQGLFYDTALAANPVALRTLMDVVAPSQVLFGTDWPFAPAAQASATAQGVDAFWETSPDVMAQVNRGNAAALFPRLA